MNTHLAVLHRPYLDRILAGEKTIEMRLTKTRRAPFGRIRCGDTIYFKQASGPIRAVATAGQVRTYTDLTPEQIDNIRAKYDHRITGADDAWRRKRQSRYGTLIWLRDVRPASNGPAVPPLYGAAWVCNPPQRAETASPSA